MNINRIVRGALGGLAGSFAMHVFRIAWEHTTHHRDEHGIFGFDHEADVKSAQMTCALIAGRSLKESSAAKLGMGLHYAYGPALGMACAALRDDLGSPWVLGAVLWLIADEVPITLSTISNPLRKSTASHAGAFLAHCLFASILIRATDSRG